MLTHPNIVGVYDIGTEQGLEYMVKEYVDGLTLKEYIQRRHHMNSDEIVKVTLKIAEALKAAHASNIIHRDIKPQNVLVTPKGEVKVTDFESPSLPTRVRSRIIRRRWDRCIISRRNRPEDCPWTSGATCILWESPCTRWR